MSKTSKVADSPFTEEQAPQVDFIPAAGRDFVVTPYIRDLTERAVAYLTIGYPVHLSGPAGTGKSTLAMHIASQVGRPCTLLHGDDEFKASDLLGRDSGYQRQSTVDNYISSIVKTEETVSLVWSSNRLTTACQKGHTLIYDEFTRSPATANNPFLSILEEGILNIPSSGKQKGYIKVHPDFRAIFTSNPEEYVAVHKTQDALLDRMITMRLDYQDRETESAIVRAKSQRSADDAEAIVDIVRAIRKILGGMNGPTVRAAIAIAKILDHRNCPVDPSREIFLTTCRDVLCYHTSRQPGSVISADQVDAIIGRLGKEAEPTLQAPANEEPVIANEEPVIAKPAHDAVTSDDADATASKEEPSESILTQATQLQAAVDDSLQRQPDLANKLPGSPAPTLPTWQPQNTPSDALPRPPHATTTDPQHLAMPPEQPTKIEADTASPQQMLEAAVSRFLRPPVASSPTNPSPGFVS